MAYIISDYDEETGYAETGLTETGLTDPGIEEHYYDCNEEVYQTSDPVFEAKSQGEGNSGTDGTIVDYLSDHTYDNIDDALDWCEEVGWTLYHYDSKRGLSLWKEWAEYHEIDTFQFEYYWLRVFF